MAPAFVVAVYYAGLPLLVIGVCWLVIRRGYRRRR